MDLDRSDPVDRGNVVRALEECDAPARLQPLPQRRHPLLGFAHSTRRDKGESKVRWEPPQSARQSITDHHRAQPALPHNVLQKRPLLLVGFDKPEFCRWGDDGHGDGREPAAGTEVEDVFLRLEDLGGGEGLVDVIVEVGLRLRPDEVDPLVPLEELAPVDVQCLGEHASEE